MIFLSLPVMAQIEKQTRFEQYTTVKNCCPEKITGLYFLIKNSSNIIMHFVNLHHGFFLIVLLVFMFYS